MKARELLSTSLNRKDDEPNKKLADEIIASKNHEWVAELVGIFKEKNSNIQSDAIKTLYEIGLREHPELIAPHWKAFIDIITSKNNRLVWGAFIALDTITLSKPKELFSCISIIDEHVKKGSTITIDHGVAIYAKLASVEMFRDAVMPRLIEQLCICPAKQFPMYLEHSEIAFSNKTKDDFLGTVEVRYSDLERETQRKRVEKLVKKLKTI